MSGIFVEVRIHAPMDALWAHTQDPALHERWDLRFSRIEYLPRTSAEDPQRFRYSTRIGLGLAQRFYEGAVGFTFPMSFSGIADVREWYDEKTQRFRIVVDVHNRIWGPLFGYRGSFDVEWLAVGRDNFPDHIRPLRQERRD